MTDRTPVSRKGLQSYDHLTPTEAARQAWHEPGEQPEYHKRMQREVEAKMPLLARALKRMK